MRKSKLFKKFIAILTATVAVFSAATAAACGASDSSGSSSGTSSSTGGSSGGSYSGGSSTGGSSTGGSSGGSHEIEYRFEDNVYDADLCNEITRSYINAKTESEEYDIMKRYAGVSLDSQEKVWFTLKGGQAPFTVRYADNREMTGAKTISTATKTVEFGGTLYPGKSYYYEATDKSGKIVERGTVKTENAPVRVINASGGRNIRDAGGWKTESGETVKYGLLYRGAQLNGRKGGPKLTQDGINVFRDELGIKTELDLRGASDDGGQTECAFGSDKNYVKFSIGQYDSALISSKTLIKQIFEVLADENNYPLYYHCNAGADRTGTLAFLINGLLGVSESDLTKDFELTSFGGQGKRLRSDDLGYGYGDTGVYQNDSSNYVAWGKTVNYIKNNYVKNEVTTLSGGIEKYLRDIGVKQNDLNKIKVLLLGLNEDKTDPLAREATCERGGVKVYMLGGEKFTVEVPASGHKFSVKTAGGTQTAVCENCSLSGEYVPLDAAYASDYSLSGALNEKGITATEITDDFGVKVSSSIKYAESDCGTEKFYIAESGGKSVIISVSVWSAIIKTAEELKNANSSAVINAAAKTVSGYYLIAADITLSGEWSEQNSIGYNQNGYPFIGRIDGGNHTVSGLTTQGGAGLCYNFNGEISNLTLKGEATEENAQFLCAYTAGGKISNVKIEVVLGKMPIDTANSALLGNIGEKSDVSDIIVENVVIIESSAGNAQANRNRSSAIGKLLYDEDKSFIYINGLTVVGVRPILSLASGSANVAGEETLLEFLGKENADHVKNFKVYKTIEAYAAATAN